METPSGDKGRLGARFEGFEHKPSEGMFERIAAANERGPGALGPRFARHTHPVHPRMWGRIERALRPAYLRRVWWMGAVAGLAMLGGFAAWRGIVPQDGNRPGQSHEKLVAASFGTEQAACGDSAWLVVPARLLVNGTQIAWISSGVAYDVPFPFLPYADIEVGRPIESGCTGYPVSTPIEVPGPVEVKHEEPTLPPRDTVQEEYFPEIELPKGDEAEGAWGFRVGSTVSSSTTVAKSEANLMDRNGLFSSPLGLNSDEFEAMSQGSDFERYEVPLVFGFTLDKPIGKRLHLLPGLQYTMMRSTVRSSGGEIGLTRHYLGLSSSVSYDVLQGKHASAYVMLGAQADAGLRVDADPGEGMVVTQEYKKAGNQLSCISAGGVNYMITQHLGVYGQAQANIMLLQSQTNLYTLKPVWPSAQVGLKVKI